jgi:MYXO-CTERM domain-containing protein
VKKRIRNRRHVEEEMNKSGLSAAVITLLALSASSAFAQQATSGDVVVLPTFSKVMIEGDKLGPIEKNGIPRVGDKTGSGVVHTRVVLDDSPSAKAQWASAVPLLLTYTRSDTLPNNKNSYLQGGFALVKLTPNAPPALGTPVDLPRLDGDRAFLKPNIQATDKYIVIVGASEDNGLGNNNPQSVVFVYDKQTLKPVTIVNANRNGDINKPLNLITQAKTDGTEAPNAKQDLQQRGPHSMQRVPNAPNSFVIGQQRNNDNAEVLRFTVSDVAGGVEIHVNYLRRVIEDARHCRPQISPEGYLTAVEANKQPAEIGIRLLKINLDTGAVEPGKSILIVKSEPQKNRFASQPMVADMGPKYLAISYQISEHVGRPGGNGGHTGGSNISAVQLVDKNTLQAVGAPMENVAGYARHAVSFGTMWGEGDGAPAFASLAGSSTGTGKGLIQVIPVDVAANKFGLKDPMKLYTASKYSDVANLAVRGLNNPNNQGRGFLEGISGVPNPGYGVANGFMPEVKSFGAAAIAGYTNEATKAIGKRESLWLSLIPATWKPGLKTAPGDVTDKPGANPDGTGTLPRTNGASTDTNPNAAAPTAPAGGAPEAANPLGESDSGCSAAPSRTSSTGGLLAIAVVGLLVVVRRSKEKANS